MLRLFLKKHKKKGFTLTETIVVVALIALIMACIVGFSTPITDMSKNANAKSDAISINKGIAEYIDHRLAYANFISGRVAIDYGTYSYDPEFSSKLTTYQAKAGTAPAAGIARMNLPGVLIMRFEPASGGEEPYKGTMRLYDVPLTDSSVDLAFLQSSSMISRYQVFSDAFYADYEYFITCANSIEVNPAKNKAYMNFSVTSYNFHGETHPDGLKADDIKAYYKKLYNPSDTSLTDPFELLVDEKTGKENVSFALENIVTTTNMVDGLTVGVADSTVCDMSCPDTSMPGTDIVIFYNVRRYYNADIVGSDFTA